MPRPRKTHPDPLVRDLEALRVLGWEPPQKLLALQQIWELPQRQAKLSAEDSLDARIDGMKEVLTEAVEAIAEDESAHPPDLNRSMAWAASVLLRLRSGIERTDEADVATLHKMIAEKWQRKGNYGETVNITPDGFRQHLQTGVYQRIAAALRGASSFVDQDAEGRSPEISSALSQSAQFHETMVAQVKAMFERHDYAAVLRYQEAFSRFLWVEGYIAERIELGHYVEVSALRLGKPEAQAAALIDDLGWSCVAARRFEEARAHLDHGLSVALSANLPYWCAKAHRHFGGIGIEQDDRRAARDSYSAASTHAEDIQDDRLRSEFKGGLEHDLAIVDYLDDKLEDALRHLEASVKLREDAGHDSSRTVRARALRGKIYEKSQAYALAKDEYRMGLEEARGVGRRDEEIRNLRGLARMLRLENAVSDANELDALAGKLEAHTPVPFEQG